MTWFISKPTSAEDSDTPHLDSCTALYTDASTTRAWPPRPNATAKPPTT